jgi:O-antigen/teichoic acid export membrane protein
MMIRSAPKIELPVLAKYISSNLLSAAIQLGGGLLVIELLDPAQLGLFNGMALIIGYVPLLQLGVLAALHQELPIQIGKDDWGEAQRMAAAGKGWTAAMAWLVGVCLLCAAVYEFLSGVNYAAFGFLTLTVVAVQTLRIEYFPIGYRACGKFEAIGLIQNVTSVVALILLPLAAPFGFYGLCMRALLVSMATAAMYAYWDPIKVQPRLDLGRAWKLCKTGLPIMALNRAWNLWGVINGTLILAFLGTEALGLYAVPTVIVNIMANIPASAFHIFTTKTAQQLGSNDDLRPLLALVWRPTAFIVAAMSVLVLIGWFATPTIMSIGFSKYVGATKAAQWAILSTGILAFLPPCTLFNVMRRFHYPLMASIVGYGVYYLTLRLLTANGCSLEDFPKAMTAGYAAYISCSYLFLFYMAVSSRREYNNSTE